MATADILMMGPSRVGKTSLLTSMYEQMSNQESNFTLHPDSNSNKMIQEKIIDQKKIFNSTEGLKVTDIGIKGGTAKNEYKFDIKWNGKSFQTLNFIDIPGNWYGKHAISIQTDNVKKLVRNSKVILIAIDSTCMMEFVNEDNGEYIYMEEINRPSSIINTINAAISPKDDKLILLCPVKSETYIKDNRKQILLDRVVDSYKKLLDECSNKKQICLAVTPVQTLGDIILHTSKEVISKEGKKEPEFTFKVESKSSKYNPTDCDQPLKYILPFLLSSYGKSQWFWERLMYKQFNKELKDAIEALSGNRKEDIPPFKLVQGKELLRWT